VLDYLGAEADEFICSKGERKACIQMFIGLVSAVWHQRQMSLILP
jgi:hypothetical protein